MTYNVFSGTLNPTQSISTGVYNPNGKSIVSAIFAQLTAECHRANWHHLANMIEVVHIGATCRIRLNFCFLQPTRVHNPNGKSIGSAVFAQLTAESPYILQWVPLSPKLPLPMGDLDLI